MATLIFHLYKSWLLTVTLLVVTISRVAVEAGGVHNLDAADPNIGKGQCTGAPLDMARLATVRSLQGVEGLFELVGEESLAELNNWYAKTRIQPLPISSSNGSAEEGGPSCPPSRVRVEERQDGVSIYGSDMVLTLSTLDCDAQEEGGGEASSSSLETVSDMLDAYQVVGLFGKKFLGVKPQKDLQPSLSVDEIKVLVAAKYKMNVEDVTDTPTLYIYPSTTEDYLVYFVEVLVLSDETVGVYKVALDAHSGAIISECTVVEPGIGQATNSRRQRQLRSDDPLQERQLQSCTSCSTAVTVDTYGAETTCGINSLYLDDTSKTTTCHEATLTDNSVVFIPYTDDDLYWQGVLDCRNGESSCVTAEFPACEDAISDIQYGSIETLKYLQTSLKVLGGLSTDASNPEAVRGFAHYGSAYCNAFYVNNQVVFGDCDCSRSTPLVSLDVVAHEIMHGVTEKSSGLRYSDQSGGLNEGYSDIMGCVMEFVIDDDNDTPDFLVGEALVGSWSPLRNMENPPLDGRSIGSLSDYCDGMDVHQSSGVLNKAFVTAVRACVTNGCLGVDAVSECVLLVGPLFLYANIEQLTTLSTFADAALQTCVVVDEFLTNLAAYNTCDKDTLAQFVIDGWESVGITIDSTACGSVTAVGIKTCSSGGGGDDDDGGGDDGGGICFSGDVLVDVMHMGPIPMRDVQIGDQIRSSLSTYQPVYSFAHYNPTHKGEFLEVHTSNSNITNQHPLEISAEHLIFLQGKRTPVRAKTLRVGDTLEPAGATITSILVVEKNGIYAPLTLDGTFLIFQPGGPVTGTNGTGNGMVQVSSYAAIVQNQTQSEFVQLQDGIDLPISQHTGIHMLLTPFRLFCSSDFATGDICDSYDEQGMPYYISWGIDVLTWADQQPKFLQIIMFVLAFVIFGIVMVLEQLFQFGVQVTSGAGGLAGCAFTVTAVAYAAKKMEASNV